MKFYSSEMSICLADVNYFNLDPDSFAREKGGKVQNGGGGVQNGEGGGGFKSPFEE